VTIAGGSSGDLFSSGSHQATRPAGGGSVDLFGRAVVLDGATVDASGKRGGGTAGVSGVVSAANSLVGSNPGDQVGYSGFTALSNGNPAARRLP
jgi:hypothetical protein